MIVIMIIIMIIIMVIMIIIIPRGKLHLLGGGSSNSSEVWSETSGWALPQPFPLVLMTILNMILMTILNMMLMKILITISWMETSGWALPQPFPLVFTIHGNINDKSDYD